MVNHARFDDYSNSLTGDRANYNVYTEEFYYCNTVMEHSYLEGRLRVLGGIEFDLVNMSANPGKNKLIEDIKAGKLTGMGQTATILYQIGVVYDTRDLETDPGNGIFAEATNELTIKGLGSPFTMDKTFIQGKFYKKILPQIFKKVVFAARIGIGSTAGNAPFWEIQPNWSSEQPVFGVPLRGYKTYRFLGNIMDFANFELRARFVQFKLLKQHFALSAVPVFDIGGVFDKVSYLSKWENYRYSYGIGGRIAWNVNTILRFDYAVSQEDTQFFFGFGNFF
jgi:outer membrane protein assembly factor BamA